VYTSPSSPSSPKYRITQISPNINQKIFGNLGRAIHHINDNTNGSGNRQKLIIWFPNLKKKGVSMIEASINIRYGASSVIRGLFDNWSLHRLLLLANQVYALVLMSCKFKRYERCAQIAAQGVNLAMVGANVRLTIPGTGVRFYPAERVIRCTMTLIQPERGIAIEVSCREHAPESRLRRFIRIALCPAWNMGLRSGIGLVSGRPGRSLVDGDRVLDFDKLIFTWGLSSRC
jgi:hypothetical protein